MAKKRSVARGDADPPTATELGVTPGIDRHAETRRRIMAAAEQRFRTLGFAKTTVAEIARDCGMSSANVYRFFASKLAINEAIAARLLGEVEAHMQEIADRPAPAVDRLRAYIVEIFQATRDRYLDEARCHEMVITAIEQQWHVIRPHIDKKQACVRRIVQDGINSGEFTVADAEQAATFVLYATVKFHHPQIVAQEATGDQAADIALVTDFILRALTAPPL